MPNEIITFSDPHKGSGRSEFRTDVRDFLVFQFKSVPIVVINGDFFDLLNQHSMLSSEKGGLDDTKVRDRIRFLISQDLHPILRDCPDTQFWFVRGNHENHPIFDEEFGALSKNRDNFHFYDECFVFANGLFIHGHTVMDNEDEQALARIAKRKTGNPILLNQTLPEEVDAYRRMCENIKARDDFAAQKFDHVFVGHTHVPAFEIEYLDLELTVHNTGAFWRDRTPCVMRLKCDENWSNIDSIEEIKISEQLRAASAR